METYHMVQELAAQGVADVSEGPSGMNVFGHSTACTQEEQEHVGQQYPQL
jgi:hypothetical protein